VTWEAGVSSDGFAVDLDALGTARDRVSRLTEELTGPPREVPSAEAFGHSRLAEAVNEFADQERHGLSRLVGEAESIRHGLAETIKTYQQVDEEGAGRFGGISS
jgi:hypothetical protein